MAKQSKSNATTEGQHQDLTDPQQFAGVLGALSWIDKLRLLLDLIKQIRGEAPQAQSQAGATGQGGVQEFQALQQQLQSAEQATQAVLDQQGPQTGQP